MVMSKNIHSLRLNQMGNYSFDLAWALYLESFPPEERRSEEDQRKLMLNDSYHFDVIYADEEFIGFVFWWKFEQLRYVEHLAMVPEHRNHGYGSQILEQFRKESDLPIILEVEKPKTLVQQKRINFYERLGFHLNDHEYFQPTYSKHKTPLSLLLMTWPQALSPSKLDYFIHSCHPQVFPNL